MEKFVKNFEKFGFSVKIFEAPKEAKTFDKMFILYVKGTERISSVYFYNSKENHIRLAAN